MQQNGAEFNLINLISTFFSRTWSFFITIIQLIFLGIVDFIENIYPSIIDMFSNGTFYSPSLNVQINANNTCCLLRCRLQQQTIYSAITDQTDFRDNHHCLPPRDGNNNDYQNFSVINPLFALALLFILLLLQRCNVFSNLPFHNFSSFKNYFLHLPPGTLKLSMIMIYLHVIHNLICLICPELTSEIFSICSYYIVEKLQIYRILSGTFLHRDFLHLFGNIAHFILCAPYFELSVNTTLFYFHINCIIIFIAIVESAIDYALSMIFQTEELIKGTSFGFSAVIYALFIISGYFARVRDQRRRNTPRTPGNRDSNNNNGNNDNNGSSSSSSPTPSNFNFPGTNMNYRQFLLQNNLPYFLIWDLINNPREGLICHLAGVIVGVLYVYVLYPLNLVVTNEILAKLFNIIFPISLFCNFIFFSKFDF